MSDKELQERGGEVTRPRAIRTLRPHVDAYENDDGLLLLADLPGVTSEDLDLEFDNGLLTLTGVRHLRDDTTVEYARRFNLPRDLDPDGVTARLEQGVLRVEIPRAEAYKPRRIQVQSA